MRTALSRPAGRIRTETEDATASCSRIIDTSTPAELTTELLTDAVRFESVTTGGLRSGNGVAVGVIVAVGVMVRVGVTVATGVLVEVGVDVSVAVADGVGVVVAVDVPVAVGVNEGVEVTVTVGVWVGVAVGVRVGVFDGVGEGTKARSAGSSLGTARQVVVNSHASSGSFVVVPKKYPGSEPSLFTPMQSLGSAPPETQADEPDRSTSHRTVESVFGTEEVL